MVHECTNEGIAKHVLFSDNKILPENKVVIVETWYMFRFFIGHNLATGMQYRRKGILCGVGLYICVCRTIALG